MTDDKYSQSRPLDAPSSRGLAGKREYVRGLAQRSDAEALALLVECLCDESWYLRDLAEEALLAIGERSAAHLLPLLEQGLWYTRTSAARVLGRFAHRPAVAGLLRLAGDANATVAEAAREALDGIGRGGGAIALARGLHALAADVRRRRLDELAARDHHLADRVQRMLRNDELMTLEAGPDIGDDSPVVRASEDGLEWEVLTGPPPPTRPGEEPGGRGGRAAP